MIAEGRSSYTHYIEVLADHAGSDREGCSGCRESTAGDQEDQRGMSYQPAGAADTSEGQCSH